MSWLGSLNSPISPIQKGNWNYRLDGRMYCKCITFAFYMIPSKQPIFKEDCEMCNGRGVPPIDFRDVDNICNLT